MSGGMISKNNNKLCRRSSFLQLLGRKETAPSMRRMPEVHPESQMEEVVTEEAATVAAAVAVAVAVVVARGRGRDEDGGGHGIEIGK